MTADHSPTIEARPGPAGSARQRAARRPGWVLSCPPLDGWRGPGGRAATERSTGYGDPMWWGSRTLPRLGTGRSRHWPGGPACPAPAGPSASSCPRPARRARSAARLAPGPALLLARRPPRPSHPVQPPRSLPTAAQAIPRRCSPASPASPRSRSATRPSAPRRPAAGVRVVQAAYGSLGCPLGTDRDGQLVGHLAHGQAGCRSTGSSRTAVRSPRHPQRGQAKIHCD